MAVPLANIDDFKATDWLLLGFLAAPVGKMADVHRVTFFHFTLPPIAADRP